MQLGLTASTNGTRAMRDQRTEQTSRCLRIKSMMRVLMEPDMTRLQSLLMARWIFGYVDSGKSDQVASMYRSILPAVLIDQLTTMSLYIPLMITYHYYCRFICRIGLPLSVEEQYSGPLYEQTLCTSEEQ